jgi:sodium-dependent dicarboxylate transporter 2/3/5
VDAGKRVFTIDWETAQKLPWDVLLLFGGGLSLAAAAQSSGLSQWIGEQVLAFRFLPLPLLIILTTSLVIYLTELTSNTATASVFFPILGGVADGLELPPQLLLLPAGLAASCAFMMPIATPPNAIVFGSGHITMRQMIAAGFWLNLIGLALVCGVTFLLGGDVIAPTAESASAAQARDQLPDAVFVDRGLQSSVAFQSGSDN